MDRGARVEHAEVERVLASRRDLAFHLIQCLVERVRPLTRTVTRLASVDVYWRQVGLFDGGERRQRPVHHGLHVLGVQALTKLSRAHDVAEEHADLAQPADGARLGMAANSGPRAVRARG